MLLDIVIVFLLILLNGVLAMAELAVVSAPKNRLRMLAEKHTGARVALELAVHPTRFLSTVQIGITTVGILAGAFGGATIAEMIAQGLQGTAVARYGQAIGVGTVVSAITFVSLIVGELVPKRLALAHPEAIASAVAPAMRLLAWLATPAVWLLSATSDGILRIFGLHRMERAEVTEEEIRHLVDEGAKIGVIETAERDIVERVLRLGDRHAHNIMTPRVQIAWLDLEAPQAENLEIIRKAPHSRYPVTRGGVFEAVGVVQIKDLVLQECAGKPLDLFSQLHPPLFVPETTRVLKLLEMFKTSDMHMALVVDEYGAVNGMVVLNDILEALVGDVPGAKERGDPAVVRREDGSYLVDGMLPVDGVKSLLGLTSLVPPGTDSDFSTLAGMVIAHLQRVPAAGDHFSWNGWRLEVVDMDGPRVDKVLVAPVPKQVAAAESDIDSLDT